MSGETAPSNTVRSSISFETVKRERLFRNPPTDKSAYPALIAAVQPHVDSFNAMTEACGLLEHAAPRVIGGAPFADVFHMAEAAEADFVLIQPT